MYLHVVEVLHCMLHVKLWSFWLIYVFILLLSVHSIGRRFLKLVNQFVVLVTNFSCRGGGLAHCKFTCLIYFVKLLLFMYVHIVSHLPTSFASDVFSVASVLYVFKSLTNLLYGSSVLHLSAAFHSGAVLCVVKMFLPSASYRSYNPCRHVIMYLPVSVSFYGQLAVFLRMSFG